MHGAQKQGEEMADRSPTILITDDVKVNRLLVKRCLQGYGYHFLEATNGLEALEQLRASPVDLVILDLMMPVLDGFAFLEQLQDDAQLSSVPVIVNSSLDDRLSIQKALALGSYDYFIKTLPREQLEFILPLKAKNAIHTKQLLDESRERKALLEREIQAAGRYQRFLLPQEYSAPGIDIATLYYAQLGVGGDFFDFVPLTHNKTAILIADVSGHGVLSAMVTAILKPLFRQYIQETESLLAAFKRLNQDFLTLTGESDYITAFAAIYDPTQAVLRYVNAGHPPPLYNHHASDTTDDLQTTGFILGVFDADWELEERTMTVLPHDRLLLITDGISEATSSTGTAFGTDILQHILRHTAGSPLQHTIGEIWSRLQEFTQHQLRDDVTGIAMHFQGLPARYEISLGNDPGQVQSAVDTVLSAIGDLASVQDKEAIRSSLGEILMNAIEHGNLAIGYDHKHARLAAGTFDDLVETRRHMEPYSSRRVKLEYVIESAQVTLTITDAGAGFDWQAIPDPRLAAHVGLAHGRGLLIARTNMDDCLFHPPGNRVTLVKHFSPRSTISAPYHSMRGQEKGKQYASCIEHERQ
jgi:serine phosphatase RsbU (regulator of sigma subunit)